MLKYYSISLFVLFIIFQSCNSKLDDAQEIIDKTIEVSGGEKYLNAQIEFDFRGRHYIAKRKGGSFSYEREFKDSTNIIHDYFTNDGFKREVNHVKIDVPDSMAVKYTSSTNSVNYFALLPYGLNDPAVIKKYLGETTLNDSPYYKIQVSFSEDGGGEDHEDVFLYWIHQKNFTIDYMAYSFAEDDEISFRFRVAYNASTTNGIRLQDYINYKPKDNSLSLYQSEELYKKGELIELSKIELENIKVTDL